MASKIVSFYGVLRMLDAPLSEIDSSIDTINKIVAFGFPCLLTLLRAVVEHYVVSIAFVLIGFFVSNHIAPKRICALDYEDVYYNPEIKNLC